MSRLDSLFSSSVAVFMGKPFFWCHRLNILAMLSKDELRGQYCGDLHRHFRGRRNTLDVSCCVFFCESQCQGPVTPHYTPDFTLHT